MKYGLILLSFSLSLVAPRLRGQKPFVPFPEGRANTVRPGIHNTVESRRLPIGHSGVVRSAVFSPAGDKVLTASDDGTAIIWDTPTGFCLKQLSGHTKAVRSAVFSPDGKTVLTVSDDESVKLWDAASGEPLWSERVSSAVFSPDGKMILTATKQGNAVLWDAATRKRLREFRGSAAAFSPETGKRVATANRDTLLLWETATGNPIGHPMVHEAEVSDVIIGSIVFSRDGNNLLTRSGDGIVTLWNIATGKSLSKFTGVACAVFNPDGDKFLVVSPAEGESGTVHLGDVASGKLTREIKGYTGMATSGAFSPDGKKVLIVSRIQSNIDAGILQLWDLAAGTFTTLQGNSGWFTSAAFGNNGKILTVSEDSTAKLWDPVSRILLADFRGYINLLKLTNAFFSSDSKKLLTFSNDGTTKAWSIASGISLTELKHINEVVVVVFTKDGTNPRPSSFNPKDSVKKKLEPLSPECELRRESDKIISVHINPDSCNVLKYLTTSSDGTVQLWNSAGKLRLTLLIIGRTDYMVVTPEGYYTCTPYAAQKLFYVRDTTVFSFEQQDIQYNRPDKVLEALGCQDTSLINFCYRAYLKRLEKLNFKIEDFKEASAFPELEIVNRNHLVPEKGKLQLHIRGRGFGRELASYNVWVNSVPVFGSGGVNIRMLNKDNIDVTVPVILSGTENGENWIKASVTNKDGRESSRSQLFVRYAPDTAVSHKKEVYFIGIGSSVFADKKNRELKCPINDIRDLVKTVKKNCELTGQKLHVDTFFNYTAARLINELKKVKKYKLMRTSVNAKVIVAFSGHGYLSANEYYLSTYTIKKDNPRQGGLHYDLLEDMLDSIPARNKLMLMDACNSGEIDKGEKDEKEEMTAVTRQRAKHLSTFKSKGVDNIDEGMMKKYKTPFYVMPDLFANVEKNTGATIISASMGYQNAWEMPDSDHSVFTSSVLEYMLQNEHVRISDLKQYVKVRVPQKLNRYNQKAGQDPNSMLTFSSAGASEKKEKEKYEQDPTIRSEPLGYDWQLW